MNNIKIQALSRQPSINHPVLPLSPDENRSMIRTIQNIHTKETSIIPTNRYPNGSVYSPNVPQISLPPEKNNSFSDIISPQNVHTAVNMSLERELENNVHKSLNTMSARSNIFEQSSIHQEGEDKQGQPSGFDMKEHESLLNEDLQNVEQPNKRVCILCHSSLQVQAVIVGPKNPNSLQSVGDYDLIYPCLCNIKAHRECLKSYLLMKKIMSCERCKATYAISGRRMREVTLPRENAIVMTTTVILCIIIMIAGAGLLAASLVISSGIKALAIVGIAMLAVGVLGITYLVWRKYFSRKIVDIAVHCRQTEIARHQEGAERTFKLFVEQEEDKKNSRVLGRAQMIFAILDLLEFETFVKMTTPRIEKPEKIVAHERHGSSNFLLPDQSKPKEGEEGSAKKIKKEIFIAPTEVERSEATIHDNFSNINEYSAKVRSKCMPQIRVTESHPSKHVELQIRKELMRQTRPDARRQGAFGSQSERKYIEYGAAPQSFRVVRPQYKDQQNPGVYSIRHGYTTRDKFESPDLMGIDSVK